jgi:hypothetical protein
VKTTALASFIVLLSCAPASAAPSETPGTILSVAIPAGAATGALLVLGRGRAGARLTIGW